MKYMFESFELAIQAEQIISANMGYTLPNRHDVPRTPNNTEHEDYGKGYITEVTGDAEHHALWMVGVDGVIPYELKEYDPDWFLPEEI